MEQLYGSHYFLNFNKQKSFFKQLHLISYVVIRGYAPVCSTNGYYFRTFFYAFFPLPDKLT